jgi:two-component system NtrC family sensor kinase
MAATEPALVAACREGRWTQEEVAARLEVLRAEFGLDLLGLVSVEGRAMMRAVPPYATGDSLLHDPLIAGALSGKGGVATQLVPRARLEREGGDALAERAFLALEETPRARPTLREAESRGLIMTAAIPVRSRGQVVAALYGGVLLNRNVEITDEIRSTLYGTQGAEELPLGTATIFLGDARIATTVRLENGNRALGTRVSKEVADRVLDNGRPWVGRAFVVRDWYLTAYEPIRDSEERIVGMLYVGILERPFDELGAPIIWRYVGLTLLVVLLSLALAYFLADRIARPIHRLVLAARTVHEGSYPEPVETTGASSESAALIEAFNEMVVALREREEKLSEANVRLEALNRSYMETLSFVTHQLNTPVASMMNYTYLLEGEFLGPLTEKQRKAVRVLDASTRRLTEMVRHYLGLARVERGELRPSPVRVAVRAEVLDPLLEALEPQLAEREMALECTVPPEVAVQADANMTRDVFENLLGNAIKYGGQGARISITAHEAGEMVAFAVGNGGGGIPAELIPRLFQKFSRLESQVAAGPRPKGTGLGLFLCKHIVEAHGGEISVTSRATGWVEFNFTLPRGSAEAEVNPAVPPPEGDPS